MRLLPQAQGLGSRVLTHSHPSYQVAKRELALECDYRHELAAQARFRDLVANDPELNSVVDVPDTVPELSSPRIMTSEWVHGLPIDKVCLLVLLFVSEL